MPITDAQKDVLLKQLDSLPSDQWLAMVRWMLDRILDADRSLATKILVREASRRQANYESSADWKYGKLQFEDFLESVFRDVDVAVFINSGRH